MFGLLLTIELTIFAALIMIHVRAMRMQYVYIRKTKIAPYRGSRPSTQE